MGNENATNVDSRFQKFIYNFYSERFINLSHLIRLVLFNTISLNLKMKKNWIMLFMFVMFMLNLSFCDQQENDEVKSKREVDENGDDVDYDKDILEEYYDDDYENDYYPHFE